MWDWLKKKPDLTPEDRRLAAEINLPDETLREIKASGENLRQLEGRDADDEQQILPGLTIDVKHRRAAKVVRDLERLLPAGYIAFVSGTQMGIYGAPDEVSVLKAADPLDAITGMGTNGNNYGIYCDMVAARLREWDRRFGLLLRGAGGGWLEAEFRRQPDDMMAFAREVYAFCPDVVDQGCRSVEKLAAEMKRRNMVYLWWD
ncbi:MAG TPA: DUF4253 domain-containing protein [Bryobacteraceae bacterium]|nr:DUF4253 domain-containing protein [Bryobacteraceae bacterium]